MHNGGAQAGLAAPNFLHGRYSKYLPDRLLAKYEAAMSDPALLDLSSEVALIDARIGQLVEQLGERAGGEHWQEAKDLHHGIEVALQRAQGDPEHAQEHAAEAGALLRELGQVLASGKDEAEVWARLADTISLRRRLAETESRLRVQAGTMIHIDTVTMFISAVIDMARETMHPEHFARFMDRVRPLLAGRDPGHLDA